jgi:hypothetical protein
MHDFQKKSCVGVDKSFMDGINYSHCSCGQKSAGHKVNSNVNSDNGKDSCRI